MTVKFGIFGLLLVVFVGCSDPVSLPQATTIASHPEKVGHPIVGGWEGDKSTEIIYFREDGTGYVGDFSDGKIRSLKSQPPLGTSPWKTQEFSYQTNGNAVEVLFESGDQRRMALSEDQQSLAAFGRSFTRTSEAAEHLELRVP